MTRHEILLNPRSSRYNWATKKAFFLPIDRYSFNELSSDLNVAKICNLFLVVKRVEIAVIFHGDFAKNSHQIWRNTYLERKEYCE